jgi:NADH:ubiquinone oxidoreductase subunit 4 (subunit M)
MLAGVLLKLGGYGFIKVCLPILRLSSTKFGPLVLVISVVGCIYTSLTTVRQVDLKRVIAYASIGHMSVCIGALFVKSVAGLIGSVSLMLAHGLVSGGLFYLVGCIYSRLGTRNIKYYGGLFICMRLFSFMFIIFSFGNISVPGLFSFVAETLIFIGVLTKSLIGGVLLAIVIILGAIYTM